MNEHDLIKAIQNTGMVNTCSIPHTYAISYNEAKQILKLIREHLR